MREQRNNPEPKPQLSGYLSSCPAKPRRKEDLIQHDMGLSSVFQALLIVGHVAAAGLPRALNITALSSRRGYSVLECWQLSSVPMDYMAAVNYAVGNTTVATWSRIEPRTTVGEAWAPHVQYAAPRETSRGAGLTCGT